MDIHGSVALVTGASSGIGVSVAEDLARRGATVVVVARREPELEATAESCRRHSADSFAVMADLSDPSECERVVEVARDRLGQVDILVNNAGVSLHRHALATTPAVIEDLFRINFFAAVRVTSACLPAMVERHRGSVVNVTSVAGYIPNPRESAYGASKAALHQWSHGLVVDLAGSGVHVGVVSPGPIDTEIWGKDGDEQTYRGPKYPPAVVADGVAQMIDKELVHMTVPRRYGVMGPMYALPVLGAVVRRGLIRFARNSKPARR